MVIQKWHPVTHDFGLINAPLRRVVEDLQRWHVGIGIKYQCTELTSSLEETLRRLLPLSNSKERRLFFQTDSDWVACYQNGIQGSDPFPAMSMLVRRLGVMAMRVCSTESPWPAQIWEVYAPEALGGKPPVGHRRAISVLNDGGRWVFEQSGEPFPFEQIEAYAAPRKKDRFGRQQLLAYLSRFAIRPFEDSFLRVSADAPAVLLQQITKLSSLPKFTLEEVIKGVPWRHG